MKEYDKKYLADFLEKYNTWRRDSSVPPKTEMPCVKELGVVIELAIKELRKEK